MNFFKNLFYTKPMASNPSSIRCSGRMWEMTFGNLFMTLAYTQFTETISETLLVIIPNHDDPRNLKDFHPIRLCNVLYKLVTKVLVHRLRSFLGDLISPLQSGFIPG